MGGSLHTAVWWREDGDGRLLELVALGPGPPPLQADAWVHRLALGAAAHGSWALANITSLGPLPSGVADWLERPQVPEPSADGTLNLLVADDGGAVLTESTGLNRDGPYEQAADAALDLASRRLGERIVASQPQDSGIGLARLGTEPGAVVLEVAPVAGEPRSPVWIGGAGPSPAGSRFGVRAGGGEAWANEEARWDDADVRSFPDRCVLLVPTGEPIRLPLASHVWPLNVDEGPLGCRFTGGAVEVTVPPGEPAALLVEMPLAFRECRLPGDLCARWARYDGDDPVVHLGLDCLFGQSVPDS